MTFARDQVRSVVLAGAAGGPVGLFYPSEAFDGYSMMSWAAEPIIELDHAYHANAPSAAAYLATAPWSPQSLRGSRPFYVMGHGSPASFGVYVTAGGPSGPQVDHVVDVDGSAYGEILATDPGFRAMTRADPGRTVVLLSCATGSPSGDAAARVAQMLRAAGHLGSVYAPAGVSWGFHGTGVAGYGVLPGRAADGSFVPGVFREMSGSPAPAAAPEVMSAPMPAPRPDDAAGSVGDGASADHRGPAVDPGRVRSVVLTAPGGLVLGLSYHPAGSPLHDQALGWAGPADRPLDHSYVSTSFRSSDSRPALVTVPRPAPWAGRVPFYVHVPGEPDGFRIEADATGSDTAAGPQLVRVDGAAFAGVVVADLDFAAALDDEPDRPVVLLAPDAANPIGRAARTFADALHERGYLVDVYAPTGPGLLLGGSPGQVAEYSVGPDGLLVESGRFRFSSPVGDQAGGRPAPDETRGTSGGRTRASGGGRSRRPSDLGPAAGEPATVGDAAGPGNAAPVVPLVGRTSDGTLVPFDADQVDVIRLTDSMGRVVGGLVPQPAGRRADHAAWAAVPDRGMDAQYRRQARSGSWYEEEVPWAAGPFAVDSHGDPDGFDVRVDVAPAGVPAVSVVLKVDGPTHGRLVAGHPDVAGAVAARSGLALVYLSCRVASPAGDAARTSAAVVAAAHDVRVSPRPDASRSRTPAGPSTG